MRLFTKQVSSPCHEQTVLLLSVSFLVYVAKAVVCHGLAVYVHSVHFLKAAHIPTVACATRELGGEPYGAVLELEAVGSGEERSSY